MQNHFCSFSAEWLIDHTHISVKSCKIGLRQKFTFEVKTTKLSHQMKPTFLAGGSLTLWHLNHMNIPTSFKTGFIAGHLLKSLVKIVVGNITKMVNQVVSPLKITCNMILLYFLKHWHLVSIIYYLFQRNRYIIVTFENIINLQTTFNRHRDFL